MNADEIKVIIERDVQELQEHKDEIKKMMVLPSMETFESIDSDDFRLWIVGKAEEYYLTFDESSGRYGLAFRTIMNDMAYLGDDGSIADAYRTLTTREEPDNEYGGKSFKPGRRCRNGFKKK